jgi:hypothetical protein
MWEVRFKEKVIYTVNTASFAKYLLHVVRLNGGDGFVHRVGKI